MTLVSSMKWTITGVSAAVTSAHMSLTINGPVDLLPLQYYVFLR